MKHIKRTESAVNNRVFNLADDLARLLMQEHKLLQNELTQITALSDSAVQELGQITMGLKRSSEEIMLAQLDRDNRTLEKVQCNLQLLNDQIHASTSDTVRALQFEDILKQLIGHVLKRAVSMDSLFTTLAGELINIKDMLGTSGELDIDKLNIQLDIMREQIHGYKSTLPNNNPVKQDSMKPGKVEIF